MDRKNFIIFNEYENKDNKKEIHSAVAIYKNQLLAQINNSAVKFGLKIIG